MTPLWAASPRFVACKTAILHRGHAGTLAHSRELIFDYRGIAVRKLKIGSARQEDMSREPRPGRPCQGHTDSRLASLYQDTFEAPIPQDMLRLVEALGSAVRQN